MARVPKTEVYVYGRNIKYKHNLGLIARTMILGSVYGGGDVANVGNNEDAVKNRMSLTSNTTRYQPNTLRSSTSVAALFSLRFCRR